MIKGKKIINEENKYGDKAVNCINTRMIEEFNKIKKDLKVLTAIMTDKLKDAMWSIL